MSDEANDGVQPSAFKTRFEELELTCFVIMPFGKKKVDRRQVDFDKIYHEIFEPAITNAQTPEGKHLIAKRTDKDAFSSSINQEMFEYIMYSRVAFADISGVNPNVFYEIGARHATQESGTVLFRQPGQVIPFDIKSIKVFDYEDRPKEKAAKSVGLISDVLTETLKRVAWIVPFAWPCAPNGPDPRARVPRPRSSRPRPPSRRIARRPDTRASARCSCATPKKLFGSKISISPEPTIGWPCASIRSTPSRACVSG